MRRLVWFITLMFAANVASAAITTFHKRIAASSGVLVAVGSPDATENVQVTASAGTYVDLFLDDYLTLGVDFNHPTNKFFGDGFDLEVDVLVTPSSGPAFTQTLAIEYKPFGMEAYKDKDIYHFTGVDDFTFTITDVRQDGVSVPELPENIFVDGDILVNRAFDFTVDANTPIDFSMGGVSLIDSDCDPDTDPDEILVTWPTVSSAIEYQLEWTFVNDYDGTRVSGVPGIKPDSTLDYNFRSNATRISTVFNSYSIPLVYEHGYLMFRVRAVGIDPSGSLDTYIFGVWSEPDPEGSVSDFITSNPGASVMNTTEHEYLKNWQCTTTFAEEGKKKEVISYFDGSLRNRQTITRINSDDNVIVGETIYDSQGRPAVNVLPVPVECSGSGTSVFRFYPNFNRNLSEDEYSRLDFDLDAGICTSPTSKMSPGVSGAARYYSDQNPNKTAHQAFVPESNGVPFTQIEYTPDNTGRIRRQSGVGEKFMLDTGHETKYYYGAPFQIELDRLFATEVGIASHYKKNLVVDPNGQISISMLDQEGRVVATSLAGEVPENLAGIPSADDAEIDLTVDLFEVLPGVGSTTNNLTPEGDGYFFMRELLVSTPGDYEFSYDLSVDIYNDTCTPDVCFNCVYDLEIKLTDECGAIVTDLAGDSVHYVATEGHFTTDSAGNIVFTVDCNASPYQSNSYDWTANLGVGNYTITKRLTINEDAVNYALEQYIDTANNECVLTLEDFQEEYLANVDTSGCNPSCDECVAALGSMDDFVTNGLGTASDWQSLVDECQAPCTSKSFCEVAYELMLSDVSPGGQYGLYQSTSGVNNVSGQPLSVFNTGNLLSGNWQNPSYDDGTTIHNYYPDDNGDQAIVYVTITSPGVSDPAVVNFGTQVFFDSGSGMYFTYPRHLASVYDFIDEWEPSWAEALVSYHPEYCYYEICKEYRNEDGNGNSSDGFDIAISAAQTYAAAVANGFINSGTGQLEDYTSTSSPQYDPYITQNLYPPYTGVSGTLASAIGNYITIGSSTYTLAEYASLLTFCQGDLMGAGPIPPGCATEYLTTTDVTLQDDWWRRVVALYLSKKQQVQNDYADEQSIAGDCYNDCIGNDDWHPFTSGFWAGGLYPSNLFDTWLDPNQPCSAFQLGLYLDKTKRFPDDDELDVNLADAQYQMYLQTGQCPTAYNFQALLSEVAQSGGLQNAGTPLTDYGTFSALYIGLTNTVGPNPLPAWEWSGTAVGSVLSVDITDPTDPSVNCGFKIDAPGLTDWNDVLSFTQLQSTGFDGTAYGFTVNLVVDNGSGGTTLIPATGFVLCWDIENCSFPPTCDANELGESIEQIMTLLAQEGNLTSVSPYAFGTQPVYPSLTSLMLVNTLSATASSLTWSYNSGTNTGTIGSSGDELKIVFTSATPSGFGGIASIAYFDNLQSNDLHYFTVDAYNSSGTFLTTLGGEVYVDNGTTMEPVEVGSCELPTPIFCDEEEHHVMEDLYDLLTDVLLQSPFDPNINLFASPQMTSLLQGYFDLGVTSTSGTVSQTPVTGGVENVLTIANGEGQPCDIVLSFVAPNATIGFDDLVSLGTMVAVPPINNFNSFNNFEIEATFNDGSGGTYTTILEGTGCFPLKNCEICDTVVEQTDCERIYQDYVAAYEANVGICKEQIPFYSIDDFINANYCCNENNLSEFEVFVSVFEEHPCQTPLKEIEPCKESGPVKESRDVSFENSSMELAKLQESVDALNTREGFVAGTAQYVTAPSIEETILQRYANFYEAYAAYLDNYNPAIDDSSYLYSIEDFIKVYGYCTDVTLEYDRYVAAVQDYNARAASLGMASMVPVDEATFQTENFGCHCSNYVKYLESCPSASTTDDIRTYLISEGAIDPTAAPDACEQAYQDYLTAYNYFIDNNPTAKSCVGFTPLISKTDFVKNNLCTSDALAVFADYTQSFYDTSKCPDEFKYYSTLRAEATVTEKECRRRYEAYENLIFTYNNSAYAAANGHSLPLISLDLFIRNFCECLDAYTSFLHPYLADPADLTLPLPPEISKFQGCEEQEEPGPCDQAYEEYIAAVAAYNDYVGTSGVSWPKVTILYGPGEITPNGLCYCVNAYVAFLNSMVAGTIDVPSDDEFRLLLDLETHCEDAPCTPDVPPGLDQFPVITFDLDDPCVQQQINIALQNAEIAYQDYISGIAQDFIERFTDHCLGTLENFSMKYTDKQHHFTLYYYDQAGNLVKTIPPEGVEFVNTTSSFDPVSTAIATDRANNTQTVFTFHRLATLYDYNSLNQLVRQCLPDHDKMDICELTLPSGLDLKFRAEEVQFVTSSRGYVAGWMNYSGNRRGVLYETNDGGVTWSKVDHIVASDLNAIQWIDDGANNKAYAVGKHGVLLRSENAGFSWDIVPLYGDNVIAHLNDLTLDNTEDGLLVGNNGTIVRYNSGAITVISPIITPVVAGYDFAIGTDDHITSISTVGSDYYITVDHNDASGNYGLMYRSSDGVNWEVLHQVKAPALTDVQFVNNSTAFAVGANGLLIKTVDAGDNWFVQPTQEKSSITNVFFKDASNGVAIRNGGLLYSTHDGGNTWMNLDPITVYNDLMAYDQSPGTAKLVAAGNSGAVARVILASGTAVALPIPTGSAVNLQSVWASNVGSQVYIVAGGTGSDLYYSTNAGSSLVTWNNASTPLPSISEMAFDLVGSNLNGAVSTATGNLHGVFLNTVAGVANVTSGTIASGTFTDIANGSASSLFALSGTTTHQVSTSGSTPPSTSSVYQTVSSGNNHQKFAVSPADDLLLVNISGQIDYIPFSGAQEEHTFRLRPQLLNDGVEGVNRYVAAGENGQLIDLDLTVSSNNQSVVVSTPEVSGFNAIDANSANMLVVGNNSTAYRVTGTSLSPVVASGHLTDVHLDDASTNAYLVSAQGDIYYSADYTVPAPVFVSVPNTNSSAFRAIDAAQNSNVVYVGDQSKVYIGTTISANETKEVYTPELRDVHFKDQYNGYTVGDDYTVRHTADGGNTWNIVLPGGGFPTGVPVLRGVETLNSSEAILIGMQKYVANSNNVTSTQLPISSIPGSTAFPSGGYGLHDITFTSASVGFIVGGNNSNGGGWQTTDGGLTWTLIGTTGGSRLRAVHGFTRNNTFIATGDNGVIAYWDGTTLNVNGVYGQTITTDDMYDIFFHDDVNGYVVGEDGWMLKTTAGNLNASTGLLTSLAWVDKSIDDDLLGQTNENLKDVWTISFATRFNGFLGGQYGANPRGFWRNIRDESEKYSTYFYYDKLGRIVVSQDTRQYNAAEQRYSYTLYDALGRVVQAGEKVMDDASNPSFQSIFGSYVGGLYNPKVIDDLKLQTWIDGPGTRQQVTTSFYDNPVAGITLPAGFVQNELRKRIGTVMYEEVFDGDATTYNYATHYSYDVHGNVSTLVQDNQSLLAISDPDVQAQQFKRMDYDYDLISGNVHQVSYQAGEIDAWHHRYEYDADNRILNVETSADEVTWDMDCKYIYYDHGPLARTETGQLNVQGTDYAYTLQGWLKGVNSNTLNSNNDMGRDGNSTALGGGSNPNENFALDAMGYSLGYYNGDYTPIEPLALLDTNYFLGDASVSDLNDNRNDLFNGNISSMVTTIVDPPCFSADVAIPLDVRPQGMAYIYDQLNRIKEARAFQNLDLDPLSPDFNTWAQTSTYGNEYYNEFTYDASGNILTQQRRDEAGGVIDQLEYQYARVGGVATGGLLQNRLYGVTDAVADGDYPDDIDNMTITSIDLGTANDGTNNYRYDEEGHLVQDTQEEIAKIVWRVDDKIDSIIRIPGSSKSNLTFDYDPLGNRVAKHQYDNAGNWEKTTYYVRDAQGNVMLVYTYSVDGTSSTASYHVDERNIYGSSRIGMSVENIELIGATGGSTSFSHILGNKRYECTNHLGNVLTVITDAKIPQDENSDGTTDYNVPTIMTAWDYYPFGALMPARQFEGKKVVETTTTVETVIETQDFESDPTGTGVTPSGWSVNTGQIGVKP